LNRTLNFNGSYSSGSLFIGTLNSGNTTKHENWSCSMQLNDGALSSEWAISGNLTIMNSLPIITLANPDDWNTTTNRTPEFGWGAVDDDNDALTYEFNISDHKLIGAFNCDDSRFVEGLTQTSYVPGYGLLCFYDRGYVYNWTVRANDGEGYGAWASSYVIGINATNLILLTADEVSFDSLTPLDPANDTTNNNPSPFVIENIGNSVVNVSVNSTPLWNTQSIDSSYYQFKVDSSGESGAFKWLSSIVDWFNMPLTGEVVAIDSLNYTDSKDSAEVDIGLELPPNENPGVKGAVITFIGRLAE